jgi:2,3,4,5-tetrahydropyridine-2-carboxylate N-succinyltransferase
VGSSREILDVTSQEVKKYSGFVPPNSVVIPGATQKRFPAGDFSVPCALIIGKRNESTNKKTSLNQVLRDFEVAV